MAEDVNPQRRAELNAEKDQIVEELRGLYDMANDKWSAEMIAIINHEIQIREARRGKIQVELDALDNVNSKHDELLADGYPGFPPVHLTPEQQAEVDAYLEDIDSASDVLKGTMMAAGFALSVTTVPA